MRLVLWSNRWKRTGTVFVGITNTPRDYAWGSEHGISDLLGIPPTGGVEAELWLGDHPGSPSVVVDGGGRTLIDVVDEPLPFLMKVLAARSPLSLQAHPTMEQAAEGFAREDAAGIPLDAPHRNYRDRFHKPEILFVLSERFEALCGFRSALEVHGLIGRLIEVDAASPPSPSTAPNRGALHRWLDRMGGDESIPHVFEWLITRGEGVDDLVARVTELSAAEVFDGVPEFETVRELAAAYPGDAGVVISLLLNRATLHRGEVLWLPAGNIHAYLSGVGIELMASSDNVLRGGLTQKHIDVPELLRVLDFRPTAVPYLPPASVVPGIEVFAPGVPDFALTVIDLRAAGGVAALRRRGDLGGGAIALCVSGSAELSGPDERFALDRGEAVYFAHESPLRLTGDGLVFVATAGEPAK
jgi:mannose-6-phosphate isomerase